MQNNIPEYFGENPQNSVDLTAIQPDDFSDTIFLVDDHLKLSLAKGLLSECTLYKQTPFFEWVTGYIESKKVSIVNTGIGIGKVDLILNTIDQCVNPDINTDDSGKRLSLHFVQLASIASAQQHVCVGSKVLAEFAMGMDNLLHFYDYQTFPLEEWLSRQIELALEAHRVQMPFYLLEGSAVLRQLFANVEQKGILATTPGYFAPRGLKARKSGKYAKLLKHLSDFQYKSICIHGFDAEASAIHGLSRVLNHNCCSLGLVTENLKDGTQIEDFEQHFSEMVSFAFDRFLSLPDNNVLDNVF